MNNMEMVPTNTVAGGPTLRCRRCGFTVCDGSSVHDCDGILEEKHRYDGMLRMSLGDPRVNRMDAPYTLPRKVAGWLVVGYCKCGSPIYAEGQFGDDGDSRFVKKDFEKHPPKSIPSCDCRARVVIPGGGEKR